MDKYEKKREHQRVLYNAPLHFTVLSMRGPVFRRIHSTGMIINASKAGVGISTEFPLQPGQVLHWDDSHRQKRLHIAMVKWSMEEAGLYRGGLTFL